MKTITSNVNGAQSRILKTASRFMFACITTISLSSVSAYAQDSDEVYPLKGTVRAEILEKGDGWNLSRLYTEDGAEPVDVYMVSGTNGVRNAPIPDSEKVDLLNDIELDRKQVVEETGETLTSEGFYVINKDWMEKEAQSERQAKLHPFQQEPSSAQCNAWNDATMSLFNLGYSHTFGQTWSTSSSNGLAGSVGVTVPINAGANATLDYKYKRTKQVLGCFPYLFAFKKVQLTASASANATVSATGTAQVGYKKNWEKELAKPYLGAFSFMVGYVPVYIPINLPISADLEVDANASASINLTATGSINGSATYTCTDSGCSGTSSLTTSFTPPNLSNSTAQINGRVYVTPGIYPAIRAALYDDSILYAQVGPRGTIRGDLWGYAGNTCGDADGNGVPEVVAGLTLDLDWGFAVRAQVAALGSAQHWDFFNASGPIAFWDLLSGAGGSSALRPMIIGPSSVVKNASNTYNFRMRPCYPYTSTTTYQINWGDGTTSTVSGAANVNAPKSKAYSATGSKTLSATADSDNHNRDLNHTTSRTITVTN